MKVFGNMMTDMRGRDFYKTNKGKSSTCLARPSELLEYPIPIPARWLLSFGLELENRLVQQFYEADHGRCIGAL